MISCRHARQLFDRYLDGELSPSLEAELHAHQLSCLSCQGELALLEACGDVISGDRREPRLSSSFTDAVLSAYRPQRVVKRRDWGRLVAFVASPLAAAASIALVVASTLPSSSESAASNGIVMGEAVAIPKEVQEPLGVEKLSAVQKAQLAVTPEASVESLDAVVQRIVESAVNTMAGARRGAAELELLVREAASGPTEKLVEKYRSTQIEKTPRDSATPAPGYEPDPWDLPTILNQEPSSDSDSKSSEILGAL